MIFCLHFRFALKLCPLTFISPLHNNLYFTSKRPSLISCLCRETRSPTTRKTRQNAVSNYKSCLTFNCCSLLFDDFSAVKSGGPVLHLRLSWRPLETLMRKSQNWQSSWVRAAPFTSPAAAARRSSAELSLEQQQLERQCNQKRK